MATAAVFLDRDGVINEEVSYVTSPDQLTLIPGSAHAIRALNGAGRPAIVITNQAAVARGLITEEGLADIHDRLARLLAAEGAFLDGIFYSPFHPEGRVAAYRRASDCRKPGPGLLLQAAEALDLSLPDSVMIGDTLRDMAAARAAGVRTAYMVRTGHGPAELARLDSGEEDESSRPSAVFDDLGAAVTHLLNASPDDRQGASAP